jgi:hypothetical protein
MLSLAGHLPGVATFVQYIRFFLPNAPYMAGRPFILTTDKVNERYDEFETRLNKLSYLEE